MATSSIHIIPVKSTSETHNLRLKDFDYVRKDLTKNNFNWGFENKIADVKKQQELLYQQKIGQKMQKTATPIREGVFIIEQHHTNDDILNAIKGIESKFKVKPMQLSVHRDEGHYDKATGAWKPNLHAHVVFDWQDKETGKSVKLTKEDMSDLQSYLSEALRMQRGKKSTKKHLSAIEFKTQAKLLELQNIKLESLQMLSNASLNLLGVVYKDYYSELLKNGDSNKAHDLFSFMKNHRLFPKIEEFQIKKKLNQDQNQKQKL